MKEISDMCMKRGSSQGQHLALTVLFVPNWLDSSCTKSSFFESRKISMIFPLLVGCDVNQWTRSRRFWLLLSSPDACLGGRDTPVTSRPFPSADFLPGRFWITTCKDSSRRASSTPARKCEPLESARTPNLHVVFKNRNVSRNICSRIR